MISDNSSRHTLLSEIGKKGQEKIAKSKILVVGAGGIGTPLLLYLALAGVAEVAIVDDDFVEESNLQRQILFNLDDIDKNKALAVRDNLAQRYYLRNITAYPKRFNRQFGEELVFNYDLIVDATDNLKTKFLLNELSLEHQKIFVSGAFIGWRGYYAIYKAGINRDLPCFACFHGDNLELNQERACFNQGVIAPGVATVGIMMATDIIKEICGVEESIAGKMMIVDFLSNKHRVSEVKKRSECKYCSN